MLREEKKIFFSPFSKWARPRWAVGRGLWMECCLLYRPIWFLSPWCAGLLGQRFALSAGRCRIGNLQICAPKSGLACTDRQLPWIHRREAKAKPRGPWPLPRHPAAGCCPMSRRRRRQCRSASACCSGGGRRCSWRCGTGGAAATRRPRPTSSPPPSSPGSPATPPEVYTVVSIHLHLHLHPAALHCIALHCIIVVF